MPDSRKDEEVTLEGAAAKAEAGILGGKAIRNYYAERPWLRLFVALLGVVSVIAGYVLEKTTGAFIGAFLAVIMGLLPPVITRVREKTEW